MRRRTRIYWLCQLIGWSSWTTMGLLYARSGDPSASVLDYLPGFVSSAAIAIGWTHVYRSQIRRRGWAALGPGALARRVIPASFALGVVIPYTAVPLYMLLYPERTDIVGRWTLAAVMGESWSVVVWSCVYFGVHYFERWRQAEVDKLQLAVVAAEATLNGLMSQLNPHFLFNCLNSVRALIVEDPAKAQAAVTALSSLMRYSMQASKVPTVALATELEMIETYLSLEQIRFDDRLRHRLAVADDTRGLAIPTMLVQLLVENGVKHGIEHLPAGGTIDVTAWRAADTLHIRVTSSGRIAPRAGSTQVGLANARERLRLLYAGRASLALREDAGTVIAELALPLGPAALPAPAPSTASPAPALPAEEPA